MGRSAIEPPGDRDDAQADAEHVARTILLSRLETAPRTRAQLVATLRERGVPEEVAGRVLDRFEEVGLVDDGLFARMWVDSRQSGRSLSTRALRSELRNRGVAEDLISEALAAVTTEAELRSARALAERKAQSMRGLERATQVRRLSGALARKGYGPGLTAQVVREVLDHAGELEVDELAEGL